MTVDSCGAVVMLLYLGGGGGGDKVGGPAPVHVGVALTGNSLKVVIDRYLLNTTTVNQQQPQHIKTLL